jgi:DNA repair protein SbcD/Mre11
MKFVHTADIHLGAVPDKEYSWSEVRNREIWDSFKALIQQVGDQKADLLLVAGDLFHGQPLIRELKEVNYLFSTIPDTQVVLMAGNHDYLKKDSHYLSFPWNKNVSCLWSSKCERVYLKNLDVYVYGCSYESREILEPRYNHLRADRSKGGIHILLAHGGDEKHIPIQKEALSHAGFDYIALGHLHKPQILIPGKMAYAGALEPIDRNDTGAHGYFAGECNASGTRMQFVPFAKRSYIALTVTVTEEETQYSLESRLEKELRQLGEEHIYQIFLEGYRSPQMEFSAVSLQTLGNILDVLDDTCPAFDFEAIKVQYEGSLIGEYITHFLKKDRTIIENKALYYGLHALLGG